MSLGGTFIAIDRNAVQIKDLINMAPGQIVRCKGNPGECIKVFTLDAVPLGVVAGWVSEE